MKSSATKIDVRTSSNRLKWLLIALGAAACGLAIARWHSLTVPTAPPTTASVLDKIKFYQQRIHTDPADTRSYVALGSLEEQREFYISALRHLYAARALGAPDSQVSLPIGRSLSRLARYDEAITELAAALKQMPDNVEAATNLAGVYYSAGNSTASSAVLRNFVQQHSLAGATQMSADDLRRIMLCFAESQDNLGAANVAELILKLVPNDVGACCILGHSLLMEHKYSQALPYFQKAIQFDQSTPILYYNYGLALENTGKVDGALLQFQRCVVMNPGASDAYYEMAQIYSGRKNWPLAALALARAANRYKSNVKLLYRVGKFHEKAGNPDDAAYWFSNAALAAGQYTEAINYASRLDRSPNPQWRATGAMNKATAYRGLHRMNDFLAAMKSSIHGDSANDHMQLADAYEKSDLLEKQIKELKAAAAKDPSLAANVHYQIALTLSKRGDRDGAENEFELAATADPNNPDYHMELGNLYLQRRTKDNRNAKAISEFSRVVRLFPTDATAFQNLGISYLASGDYGKAIANLEHAIDLEPGYGPAYQQLGRVYAEVGDKAASDQMLKLYHRFVIYDLQLKTLTARADQNKTDPKAQMNLGELLLRTGDVGGAIDRFQTAHNLRPEDTEIENRLNYALELITHQKTHRASAQTPNT